MVRGTSVTVILSGWSSAGTQSAEEAPPLHVAQMISGGRKNWSPVKVRRPGLHSHRDPALLQDH